MTLSLKTLGRSSFFKFLSCVVIAFGIESQEIMDVQSQLLFIGSSAYIKIMVAERKRVDGLVIEPAHPKVSPSRSTVEGARGAKH